MALDYLPSPGWAVIYGETPSATRWSELGDNDDALATGAGIDDLAIINRHIGPGAVTANETTGIWWEELARTTVSVAGDLITLTPITAKKYIRIIAVLKATGGTIDSRIRFNNDSGNNYAYNSLYSNSGTPTFDPGILQAGINGEAFTLVSGGSVLIDIGGQNHSGVYKQFVGGSISDTVTAASTAPVPYTIYAKWASTAQITRVDVVNNGTGDFAIGSEVIVLGHD